MLVGGGRRTTNAYTRGVEHQVRTMFRDNTQTKRFPAFAGDGSWVMILYSFLHTEENEYICEVLHKLCRSVGILARWFEGCHCHGEELMEASHRKRRKASAEGTPSLH